jgi:hypothetical protein
MTEILGVFGAQAFVVLIVAVIGIVPVLLYRHKTPWWFLVPYGFLFVAAFATNFENLLLPDALNFTEHLLGNMGAGIAFAAAAYIHRRRSVLTEDSDGESGAQTGA